MSNFFDMPKFGSDNGIKLQLNENIDDNTEEKCEKPSSSVNICVVGITSSIPYDSSVFVNNDKTFYTKITYEQLTKLNKLIDETDEKSNQTQLYGMNLMYVANCFTDPSIKILFRFLCSPDCNNGEDFINQQITPSIYNFVKYVLSRTNTVIEVSDHSMYSFFKNWDDSFMGSSCPIELESLTHSGPFEMYGSKNDFLSSVHPTLQQIGDMSSDEEIKIKFNNMGGTKTYKIKDSESSRVKILSKGHQIKPERLNKLNIQKNKLNDVAGGLFFDNNNNPNGDNENYYGEVPVHCEFDYQMGKIVISATHWCNLTEVDTPIDIPSLTRYYTQTMGEEAAVNLEYTLSSTTDVDEVKRIISTTVREISSGTVLPPSNKKMKINSNF